MTESKKEKWLSYLSITTIVIAVCATLSTFKVHYFMENIYYIRCT